MSPVHAAVTDIAPAPMAQASTAVVKPNLMFILDDSGKHEHAITCRTRSRVITAGTETWMATLNNCEFADPSFNSAQFNTIYYNPTITYTPPVKYDGTS